MGEESRNRLGASRRHHAIRSFAQDAIRLILLEEISGVNHHREIWAGRVGFGGRVSNARGEIAARGETKDAHFLRVGIPFGGMLADELKGAASVHHGDDPWLQRISTRDAVTQYHGGAAQGVKSTGDLHPFVLLSKASVATARTDDDNRRTRLSGRPDDVLGKINIPAAAAFTDRALGILAGLGLEGFGRRCALPNGSRREWRGGSITQMGTPAK